MTGSDLVAAKIMKKAKKALQKSESFRKGGVKHNGHRTCNGSVLTGSNYQLRLTYCDLPLLLLSIGQP